MQDQGNQREHKQQMNQTPGNMKHRETADPRDQEHDKYDCPDTHVSLFLFRIAMVLAYRIEPVESVIWTL